jgi:ribonuclease P protein subunit RPR2
MSRDIASERIRRLFSLADRRISEGRDDSQQLADRYIELARSIGMSYNVSISGELRKRFCHDCGSFLKPGVNCRVRVNSRKSSMNYTCGECGEVNRHGF